LFYCGLVPSYGWLSQRLLAVLQCTLSVNCQHTGKRANSGPCEQGLKQGDQLLSVNGTPIASSSDLKNILETSAVTQTVTVEMRTPEGEVRPATITLQPFSATDRLAFFILPMVLSLVFLIVSGWIFGLRRTEAPGRAFTVFHIHRTRGFDLYLTDALPMFGLWRPASGRLIDLGFAFKGVLSLGVRICAGLVM
jgi:hypothetical protein